MLLGLLSAAPGCKAGNGTGNETQDAGTREDAGTGADAGTPPDAGAQARVPAAPAAPRAVAGEGEALVTWTAPDNGGSAITRYTVTASPGGIRDVLPGATLTSTLITGLTPGTAYTFTVVASNGMGDGPSSSPSNAVTPTAPSQCPGLQPLPVAEVVAEKAGPALEANPAVLSSESDRPIHSLGAPSLAPVPFLLPALSASGGVGEYTPGLQLVQAPLVWDANQDGALDPGAPTGVGLKVCLIGGGIDPGHPELKAAYLGGRDFVEDDDDPSDRTGTVWGSGLGTSMAGVLAAQLGNAGTVDTRDSRMDPGGVVGVAPGVGLLVARVLDTQGNGRTSDVLAAVGWCQSQGARILLIGFGASTPSSVEEGVFAEASENGVLSIAAAGDAGNATSLSYPAAYASVLAVGAVRMDKQLASFSQTGAGLSLVAPGVDILSTDLARGRDTVKALSVAGQSYAASPVAFGAKGAYTGPLVNCGLGDSVRSCQGGTCDGFVALVERSSRSVAATVDNVRAQGAKAVVLVHDAPDGGTGDFSLGEPSASWPPTVSVSSASGEGLQARTGEAATVSVAAVDYAFVSGTAMAAAHVSGVAALLWNARPALTPAQVRQVLEASAMDLGVAGRDAQYGHGLVQARGAQELLRTHP